MKPGEVTIPHYTAGCGTAMDIMVINAMRQDIIERYAEEPKHAVSVAYQMKWSKYGEAWENEGICFIPLPIDSMGCWHDRAIADIKKLGSAMGRFSGEEDSEAIRHVFQRLALLLAKGNSSIVLNRIPHSDFPPTHVNGQF